MTPAELQALHNHVPAPQRVPNPGGDDRTLLYGWDVDGRTHHVYLRDGEVHQVIYRPSHILRPDDYQIIHYAVGEEIDVGRIVPDKRVAPEACDLDFCKALKDMRINMTFAPYGRTRAYDPDERFVGHVFEDGTAPTP